MAKKFVLDQLLDDEAVTFVINGKEFTVRDMPLEMANPASESPEDQKKFVQDILGCSAEDLAPYGLIALTKIVNILMENLLSGASQNLPSRSSKTQGQ